MPVLAPYKMASREVSQGCSMRLVGGGKIGGTRIGVIAGHAASKSLADSGNGSAVKEAGAIALRRVGRSSREPVRTHFRIGREDWKFLAEAREKTGLAIVTEVMSIEQVAIVAEFADVSSDRRTQHAELQPA